MTKRILFLAANPFTTDRLRTDEEIREIMDSLAGTQNRSNFKLFSKLAVRFKDFRRALLEVKPHIVHFSGHGIEHSGIILENNESEAQTIPAESLGKLFSIIKDIECVVLNACYTIEHAEEISNYVPCVISNNDAFSDKAAVAFSLGFYDAVFHDLSYADAFKVGCLAPEINSSHESLPVLIDNQLPAEERYKNSALKFINDLQKNKTFQSGIVDEVQVYSSSRSVNLVRATDTRHIVAIEVAGNRDSVYSILTEPNQLIDIPHEKLCCTIFVSLNVQSRRFKIKSPDQGYLLADGERLHVDFELRVRVTDTYQFWQSSKDPIDDVEWQIIQKANRYFSNLYSQDLIAAIDLLPPLDERLGINSQLRVILDGLQSQMAEMSLKGIHIEDVYIDIQFPNQLHTFLARRSRDLFGASGILERKAIDERIDNDYTFAPHKLRDIVKSLDSGLFEDFYTINYSEAMLKVHNKLTSAREAFYKQQNDTEIEFLTSLLDRAIAQSLSEEHIQRIKDRIGTRYLGIVDSPKPTEQSFLKWLLGDIPSVDTGLSLSNRLVP